ncbi:Vacuolar membrane protein [Rhodotorula toruloides ATCC 204091]|uniref:BY PROTMAP: gi/342318940/gb/EGU10895.1/ Vacuolar membrane protein [Rhodotorula glutinis ATCC 204091] n=1 Tax=Rhodotorula toruloides TaxID=5286 RepID=A0A0K3CSH3_RHOTO|nr:Vacuolar membrane protein [Rhodotorula toruloides ATCC 204091]PRQ70097.1 Vaculolar membrane protein-domain containing protein [Rhodotorula toruloides]
MDDLAPTLADAIPASNGSSIAAPILEELGNEVDLATCRLLGPFALVIQGIMGAVVILSLVAKRMREKPRRKWKIWLGDVSKQVVGQAFVHSANIAISDLIALHTSDNPCSLYALNILVDTTLGVLILYYLLRLSTHLMHTTFNQPAYQTGFYGSPFSLSLWGEQAAIYVACLTAMKVVVLVLFWAFPVLEDVMSWMLGWVTDDEAQVFIVMLVLPLVMNLFQFLMVDSILKSKDGAGSDAFDARLEETDEEALRRGFLDSHEDEDDESDHEGAGGRTGSGYSDQSPKIGRGGMQQNGRPGDASGAGGKGGAERGLLDEEEEAGQGDNGGFFALSMPAQHAYPPAARPPSSSTASTTLPPYSAHPAPPAHAVRQSVDEEDDWSADWDQASASDSASNAGGARESIPLEPVKPAAVPHPLDASPPQPARTGHVRIMSEDVGGADEWGFDADAHEVEDEEANAPGESTPPVPSTPAPRQSPPPLTTSLSAALDSSAPEAAAHDEADDWGIDEDTHAEPDPPRDVESSPLPPPPAPPLAHSPSPPPVAASSSPPPPTLAASPPPPSSPPPPPAVPPVQLDETPRQSLDGGDDWGFDADADADGHTGPEPVSEAHEATPEAKEEEKPERIPQSNGHAGAHEEEEDDWGFDGLGSPPPPAHEVSHGQSASISSAFEEEDAEPLESAKLPVAGAVEQAADVERRPAPPEAAGDEEDDDWGFDDSPSLTISSLDPNVKDVVAELEARKKGAIVREAEEEGESLI